MSQLKKVTSGLTLKKEKCQSFGKIYKKFLRDKSLKQGYKEMASLNLTLAQMYFDQDNQALSLCEEKLTECE
ncbi:MAG: hypothetical protein IJ304_02730 [Clostridia bacterium]|nr:hypothetical protein [Clostridia bacterium]